MNAFTEHLAYSRRFTKQPFQYVLVKTDPSSPVYEHMKYSVMQAENRTYVKFNDSEAATVVVQQMLAAGCRVYDSLEAYMQAVPLKPKPTEFKPWW
jgi:hypothetical protein